MIAAAVAAPARAGEGFGFFTKKSAKVNRVSPPAVFLTANRLAVKVSSGDTANAGLAQRFQAQLESELISRDHRFVADAGHPEVLIDVRVLQNRGGERWENRQELATRKVGTDAKGKDKYESYPVEVRYKIVSHSLRAAYKVSNVARGTSLDADSLAADFEQAFREGEGAPEAAQLETGAVDDLVNRIARRLTAAKEEMEVLLPQGSLESLAPLATAGLWNRYLEALEKRQPLAKPTDDAYRQYALGTAYEALGYAAEDPDATLRYLEKADSYYSGALDANPQEKYFSQPYKGILSSRVFPPPFERVQAALVGYRRLKDFKDGLGGAQAHAQAQASESGGDKSLQGAAGGGEGRMNNAAVIRMVQAGLGQDIVLQAIASAPHCDFDISANGLIALSEAKVGAPVIRRIQEVASGRKASHRPDAKRKPAKPAPAVGKESGS